MKTKILVACVAVLTPFASEGATLLVNEVLLTNADDGPGVFTLAENITEPSLAWLRSDLDAQSYYGYGHQGLDGGRVTIQTDPGETVESVKIYLGVGATVPAPWEFVFESFGSTQDIQIWVSQDPSNFWMPLNFQPDNRAPIYFEVQTSAGSFGEQYYAVSTVPEPSSGILTIFSTAALLIRRRRY